jgi:hypothetical protein
MTIANENSALTSLVTDCRRGPCFGALDSNPVSRLSEEERKRNAEFADNLVDELRATKLVS